MFEDYRSEKKVKLKFITFYKSNKTAFKNLLIRS